MNNSHDIAPEMGIYTAILGNRGFEGDTFAHALRQLLRYIGTAIDEEVVEIKARQLHETGYLRMNGRVLWLDTRRVHDKMQRIIRCIESQHPASSGMSDELKQQVQAIAAQLERRGFNLLS